MENIAQFERVQRWLQEYFGKVEELEAGHGSIETLLDGAEYELDRLRKELSGALLDTAAGMKAASKAADPVPETSSDRFEPTPGCAGAQPGRTAA